MPLYGAKRPTATIGPSARSGRVVVCPAHCSHSGARMLSHQDRGVEVRGRELVTVHVHAAHRVDRALSHGVLHAVEHLPVGHDVVPGRRSRASTVGQVGARAGRGRIALAEHDVGDVRPPLADRRCSRRGQEQGLGLVERDGHPRVGLGQRVHLCTRHCELRPLGRPEADRRNPSHRAGERTDVVACGSGGRHRDERDALFAHRCCARMRRCCATCIDTTTGSSGSTRTPCASCRAASPKRRSRA